MYSLSGDGPEIEQCLVARFLSREVLHTRGSFQQSGAHTSLFPTTEFTKQVGWLPNCCDVVCILLLCTNVHVHQMNDASLVALSRPFLAHQNFIACSVQLWFAFTGCGLLFICLVGAFAVVAFSIRPCKDLWCWWVVEVSVQVLG